MSGIDRRFFMGGALAVTLSGCSKQASGTEEIHYGRETCAKCGMVISDAHFAAEIRGGPDNQLAKFDDVGCAVNWLGGKSWHAETTTEFWVMDGETGQTWLKAREAWYTPGAMSPMNYGFLAHPQTRTGAVDYAAMQASALSKG